MPRLCRFILFLLLSGICTVAAADGFFRRNVQSVCVPEHVTYVQPVQKIVAQQVAVAPLVVTVPVASQAVPVTAYGVNHWYSVENTYQQQNLMRNIIREELNNFTGQRQPAAQHAPPQQQPQQVQQPQPQTQLLADDVTPSDVQQQVLAAFSGKANCVNCHGANPQLGGGFRLVATDAVGQLQLLKLSADKRWKVYAMSAVGAMPPAAAHDAAKAMESQHLPSLLRWASIK